MHVLQQVWKHVCATLLRQLGELRTHVGPPPIRMPALELGAKQLRVVDAQGQLTGIARPLLRCGLGPIQREVQRLVAMRLRLPHQPVPGRVRIVGAAAARQVALNECGRELRLDAVQLERGLLVQDVGEIQLGEDAAALLGGGRAAEARHELGRPAPRAFLRASALFCAGRHGRFLHSNLSNLSPIRPRGRNSSTSTISRYIDASAAGG